MMAVVNGQLVRYDAVVILSAYDAKLVNIYNDVRYDNCCLVEMFTLN